MTKHFLLPLAFLTAAAVAFKSAPAPPAPAIQLYVLDGGQLDFPDLGVLSDTGEHAGEAGKLAVACYFIHHGPDWLLWDTGLGDRLAALPPGEMKFGLRFTVRRTLAAQLAQLGLKPADIRYVALSHLHADHVGNVGLFPKATFLVAGAELAWARIEPAPISVDASFVSLLAKAHVEANDEDRDVFGDGSVRILKAPGHTPGHRVLLVQLAQSGPLLVTGDLYHTRENYAKGLVPAANVDRANTLASFNRFAGLQATTHARVIVEHSPEDFAALPPFPKYLE